MRFKINFKVNRLPIIYRHRFISLIKEALSLSNNEPEKKTKYFKQIKPFSFSIYIPQGYIQKKEKFFIDKGVEIEDIVFYLTKSASFFISSSDYQFMINLYNGLCQIKKFDFFEFPSINTPLEKEYLYIEKIFMLNEKKIDKEEVIFKTMSYISVEDDKDKPINIFKEDGESINVHELERFNYHLNAIEEKIFKSLRGYGLKKVLQFLPINLKKKGVKHSLQDFRKQTGKPYMVLTTYQGIFSIKGDPEDLQLLYQIGIGLRTGQGFGMIEVHHP